MAKQTINIGASPNDGTGTPLRTSFDYTNQNFTELYTALGGGVGLPGATTQVIFNDGGTNLAGDAGLVYNKTTDALTVGGLVTAGSATITGDLTVRTDKLAVTSTGVGFGTATPGTSLEVWKDLIRVNSDVASGVYGTQFWRSGVERGRYGFDFSASLLELQADGDIRFLSGGETERYRIDSTGISTWSVAGTTAMTLNSTGLGVGGSPQAWNTSYKGVQVGLGANFYTNAGTPNNGWFATNTYQDASNTTTFIGTGYGLHYRHLFGEHAWLTSTVSGSAGVRATMNQLMTLDASGNLLVAKTAVNDFSVGFQATPVGAVVATRASSVNSDQTLLVYSTGAAAYRFYVGMGGTVFATNTTISAISDARFKENVQDIDVGLGAILALKPRKFDWKDGKGKNIKGDRGFIAQEFETVFPNLIDEWKENAPEGEAPYKSVRQDLIPVLVKAIQELTARVQTLETR